MTNTQTRRDFLALALGGATALATGCATIGSQSKDLRQFIADYRAAKANKDTPAATIKQYEAALNQAFNDADLHLYVGFDMNNGAKRKLITMGKGAQFASDFPSLDSKVALLDRAYTSAMSAQEAPEAVLARGLYLKNYKDVVPTMLGRSKTGSFGDQYAPHSYLDQQVFSALTDGNLTNGEIRGSPAHVLVYATYTGTPSLDTKVEKK